MPMYTPDSSVLRPETPEALSCTLSIQNCVPSFRCSVALFFICTVTITCERSGLRSTVFTTPSSTSRYLIGVVPGVSPPAAWKVTVMTGPLRAHEV
jgi:hypothetical protein